MSDTSGSDPTGNEASGWEDYTELKKVLRALADVVRLNIVRLLANGGEVNVTDLAQQLLISQPLVSWHLSGLRRAGLVRTRRQGRQVYCSLDRERCRQYLGLLEDVIAGDSSRAASDVAPETASNTEEGARARRSRVTRVGTQPARQF